MEKINAEVMASSGIGRGADSAETASATGSYIVTCVGADGQVKWSDTINNLVTTVGKNDLLDKYFKGTTYTAAFYLGLVDGATTPTYAAGDTLASHAGWSEFLNYTITGAVTPATDRATPTWNSAASGSKGTTASAFTISGAGGTVAGCLLCTTLARNNAANGGAGVLYSVGAFGAGNKVVASGDTLNVTYTAQV